MGTLLIGSSTISAKGFWSSRPAHNWEEYLVSANGTLGIMVAGQPYHEIMVFNHTNLFLPMHAPLTPPSQGNRLGEFRQLMLNGKFAEASELLVEMSHSEGFGKKRQSDIFIPGFELHLVSDSLKTTSYHRSVNFNRGEILVEWSNRRGQYAERSFASRPDSVILSELTAIKGQLNMKIDMRVISRFDAKRLKKFYDADTTFARKSIDIKATTDGGARLLIKVLYAHPWQRGYVGYIGEVLVHNDGGTIKTSAGKLVVSKAHRLRFITRLKPIRDVSADPSSLHKGLTTFLAGQYEAWCNRHEAVQSPLMERTSISLGADNADMARSSEELLQLGGKHPALIQHLFDAARYNIISATGINPPNLQGIWGATMTPPWAGDYTTNGNLPTAVSHCLAASTPELMLPLFDKLESQLDDYRTNARVLFGCRGIHVPSHIQLHGYDNQFDKTWPMTFWTAGAAWYSMFYYDYYLYTLDEEFLHKRALPFMLESVAFYEDFLIRGNDGKLMFCPSYSPENHPANSKPQACINATMDVAVCKSLLRNLLATGYGTTEQKERWQKMLHELPAYEVNDHGELREWLWHDLQDNHQHRHASHLIGLFYMHDPEIMASEILRQGVLKTIRQRLAFRLSQSADMAFGISQLAFPACAIGEGETVYNLLQLAAETYFNDNLMTTHDAHSIFNTDMSGAYPAIVLNMLTYSEPGRLELLPAIPEAWQHGSAKGISARGGIHIGSLSWDGDKLNAVLTSKVDQQVELYVRGRHCQTLNLQAGVPYSVSL